MVLSLSADDDMSEFERRSLKAYLSLLRILEGSILALRRILLSSKWISSGLVFGSFLIDDSTALIVSSVEIFVGAKAKLKFLDNNKC